MPTSTKIAANIYVTDLKNDTHTKDMKNITSYPTNFRQNNISKKNCADCSSCVGSVYSQPKKSSVFECTGPKSVLISDF